MSIPERRVIQAQYLLKSHDSLSLRGNMDNLWFYSVAYLCLQGLYFLNEYDKTGQISDF